MQRILIWFRNDLRIADHEPLFKAAESGHQVIGIYCFDPRQFKNLSIGVPKTGAIRTQFMIESVLQLQTSLRALGADLLVRMGKPEEVIPELCASLDIHHVYFHQERTSEELTVENNLVKSLNGSRIQIESFWNSTLIHVDDLPFSVSALPELFTQFRTKIEKNVVPRKPFTAPKQLNGIQHSYPSVEISLSDLGHTDLSIPQERDMQFQGGEVQAWKRLQQYVWETGQIQYYKQTRNQLLGEAYSSKFSPWLGLGCITAKSIYWEVKQFEEQVVQNDSTYWLIFELLWRDYFAFIAIKHGNTIFKHGGLQQLQINWEEDKNGFERWRVGKTGYPFVDANMRELLQTGFMSNRGRQIVASFLTKNLGINWLWGAQWFESQLIDYDVCSNYGNWNYAAGVGNDARGFRYFNIVKQALDYDGKGDYVRHWLPELFNLPGFTAHEPYKLNSQEQAKFNFELGKDYPRPIVDLVKSVKRTERTYNAALR
jgi:deoxyribodipyrimidine photo-lyase